MDSLDPLSLDFARKHPDAFAKVLGRAQSSEIRELVLRMPPAAAAAVVARLPASRSGAILESREEALIRWLDEASYDDAVKLLGRMPRESCLALVNSLANRERQRRLLRFLKYPAHSVGALVSDVLMRVSADTPAADVLQELRGLQATDPGPIVVLHPDGRYLGILDLWLVLSRDSPPGPVGDYVAPVPALRPVISLVDAAQDMKWQLHGWRPVVDHEGRVLGGVSRSRVLEATFVTVPPPRGGELFAGLVTEMVRVLGALLDRLLRARARL